MKPSYSFKEIVPLLASRGFLLTKFFTTSSTLHEIIPAKDLSLVKTLQYKDEACLQNTLGMTWKSDIECFKFNCSFPAEREERVTRRRILSVYSRIFDPLGFIQPFILKPKLIIQELSRLKLLLGDEIPDRLKKRLAYLAFRNNRNFDV